MDLVQMLLGELAPAVSHWLLYARVGVVLACGIEFLVEGVLVFLGSILGVPAFRGCWKGWE